VLNVPEDRRECAGTLALPQALSIVMNVFRDIGFWLAVVSTIAMLAIAFGSIV